MLTITPKGRDRLVTILLINVENFPRVRKDSVNYEKEGRSVVLQ